MALAPEWGKSGASSWGGLVGRLWSGILGMNFFFSFVDVQRWGGKGENEPLLPSNQELICTIFFFNKTFPVKFCCSMEGDWIRDSQVILPRGQGLLLWSQGPHQALKCQPVTAGPVHTALGNYFHSGCPGQVAAGLE